MRPLIYRFIVLMPIGACLHGCVTQQNAGQVGDGELRFLVAENVAPVTDSASTGGVSFIDFDGDGDLDLLVSNGYDVSAAEPAPQLNRLYRNDGRGQLTPMDAGPVTTDAGYSSGHTWGDYDNDGDADLFVSNQQNQVNFLYRNDGEEGFSRVLETPPAIDTGHSYAAAWVDIDNDGNLDLFVANGGLSHTGPNFLYRNLGGGRFEKIVEGEIVTDTASSCGIAWGDYDNDGDADLYVANQGFDPRTNSNALYRNDGNWQFSRISDVSAVTDQQPSSSANWVDYDNDGDLDLYVANLYGIANRLFRNDGGGKLVPVVDVPVAVDGGYSQATNWNDYDNDGDLDMVVANWGSASDLYVNDGAGNLERVRAGDLGRMIDFSATITSGDVDGDGDVDLYIGNWPNTPGPGEANRLLVNQGVAGNWLMVRLVGTASNTSGIGARISVVARIGGEQRIQTREVSAQSGFRSQGSLGQHFGLGDAATVTELRVAWPSGQHTQIRDLVANRTVTITEGEP